MIDFIEYVVSELKSKRLSKTNALSLIKQFSFNSSSNAKAPIIHPLLHVNTSDLGQQSYSSTFTGEEFFLADHQIKTIDEQSGRKVLPGVAYLEMARVALENALPESQGSGVLELHNTIWAHPIVVNDEKEIGIALMENDDGVIEYEIFSQDNGNDVIHCQGQATFSAKHDVTAIDLSQLKAAMTRGTLDSANIYKTFSKLGLQYGPAHQGIKAIYQGEDQLLAQLGLPAAVDATQTDFLLHPSLMDSALQASIGLADDLEGDSKPSVPFALESLRILTACTSDMFAWVRYSTGSRAGDNLVKLDIDLCDSLGNICVQLRGFTSRVLGAENRAVKNQNTDKFLSNSTEKNPAALLIAKPVWELDLTGHEAEKVFETKQHYIILCELTDAGVGKIKELIPNSQCVQIARSESGTISDRYSGAALKCFDVLQTILKQKPQGKVLIQFVIGNEHDQAVFTGLSGLFKTA
ncbi:MAG: hypothetical protein EOO68_25445, partial [Moraxellaceae bacterium]